MLAVALLPFVLLFFLMAVLNRPAYVAAPITAVATFFSAYALWGVPANWLMAAVVRGAGVTLDIILVIYGAVLLIVALRELQFFEPMQKVFARVSADKRIQAIVVSWFFVGFIEGIAGFGTPAMLAIPILLALGFSPVLSVVLALVGDSVAVVFGAVGVPISIGIATGVGLPMSEGVALSSSVAAGAALFNLLLGWIIPLMMSVLVSYEYTSSWRRGLELWRFSLFSGVVFMLPLLAAAYWLTPEFPTIIGSLVGGVSTVWMLKREWFAPENPIVGDQPTEQSPIDKKTLVRLIVPYALVVIGLLLTRLPVLPVSDWLRSWQIGQDNIFSTGLDVTIAWASSPGIIFAIVALIIMLWYSVHVVRISQIFREAGQRVVMPFVGLFFVLVVVQIMLLSYYNTNDLPSMPLYLAERLAVLGEAWPLVAPFVGVIGAFIAGSSTVSNLLFSSLQYTTALTAGLSVVLVLSLQAVGSALGNMVAVHNILAAQAVAGLSGKEGEILRRTLWPVLIYGFVLGMCGLIISLIFF